MSFRLCDGWWVGGFRLIVMDGGYSFDRVFWVIQWLMVVICEGYVFVIWF